MAGLADGKAMGLQKGWEIGHEIGYYRGCMQIWRQLADKSPAFMTARAEKAVKSLEDLLTTFPLGDPKVRKNILFMLTVFQAPILINSKI